MNDPMTLCSYLKAALMKLWMRPHPAWYGAETLIFHSKLKDSQSRLSFTLSWMETGLVCVTAAFHDLYTDDDYDDDRIDLSVFSQAKVKNSFSL